ncbi:MAG: ATP-binding protein [Bacteroidota bacterium]
MNLISGIIDRLIPEHLKKAPYVYRKARILTYIHLFIYFIILLNGVSCWLYFPENNVSLIFAAILLSLFVWIFYRWGNLTLSGNLLALGWVVVLVPSVFVSGGYYSDNFLWLVLAPMVTFLFGTKLSGKIWSVLLLVFAIVLFFLEKQGHFPFKEQYLQFDGTYFFISYFFLFISILGIIIIFKKGQEEVVGLLLNQRGLLKRQKEEISLQAADLKKKEEALRSSNQELEKSNLELEQFAYAASHDLKEPLRAVKIYTQILEKQLTRELTKDTREYMGFIVGGVDRMQQLLDDLLNYSRLGRGQYKQKVIDLNDVLFMVINNLMVPINETQTMVSSGHLPSLYTSSTEMIQLFQNLISNAIKFRQSDLTPEVSIMVEEQGEDYLFRVSDNGIGIAPEHQQKVFALFERLHSHTEYEGTGIGLATCEKIIKNLGGHIWLESEVNRGTTFYFSIPRVHSIQSSLN